MYCKNCGAKNEPDAVFCAECGAPMEEQTQAEPMPTIEPISSADESQKSSGKKIPILPVVLTLIIVALVCVVIFLWTRGNSAEEAVSSQTGEAEAVEEDSKETDVDDAEASKAEDAEETEASEASEVTGEVSMKVLESSPDLNGYVKAGVGSAEASSEIYQEKYDNSAWSAFDGDEVTSWQENAAGSGVGEWLCGTFAGEYQVKYIGLKVGNWRDSNRFWGNNRPTELEISIGGHSETVYLSDEMKEQWIELSEACKASDITITIRNVVRGDNSEWNEACISEVEVYAE